MSPEASTPPTAPHRNARRGVGAPSSVGELDREVLQTAWGWDLRAPHQLDDELGGRWEVEAVEDDGVEVWLLGRSLRLGN